MLWSLSGGGVEDGELMYEALRREMRRRDRAASGRPGADRVPHAH
ncbi:NUDIX domain-containing protein [Streptomyces sp. NPDC003717]